MTAKHTPGPWTTDGKFAWTGIDMIAHACRFGDSPDEQQRANADLIAAAPEMLVSLEKCIAVLEAMDRCPSTRLMPEEVDILQEACAVVAKAKGEKP